MWFSVIIRILQLFDFFVNLVHNCTSHGPYGIALNIGWLEVQRYRSFIAALGKIAYA